MRSRPGHTAHQDGRIDLEDVKTNCPGQDRRDRAGDETSEEDEERDFARELSEEGRARVDANNGDEGHKAEIFQDVASGIRSVAEETQPRNNRRNEDAGEEKAAGVTQTNREAADRDVDLADKKAQHHADR